MGAGRDTRRYTDEERQRATELAVRVGPAKASQELGIPKATVSFWAYMSRKVAKSAESAAASVGDVAAVSAGVEVPVGAGVALPPEAPGAASSMAAGGGGATPGSTEARKPALRGAVAKRYTPSQRAEILEYAAKHGPAQAARHFKVTRFAIRDWRRKVARAAAGQATTSPVTGPDTDPKDEREKRILAVWRKHPGLGPSQVRNQLRRQGFKVGVSTTRQVMEEHGYVPPLVRRTEAGEDDRYEGVRPNQLWHLDFLHRHIHKQHIYVLLIIDDFSRFAVGGAVWDGERVAAVIETFEKAVARHGRPEAVMSDGGSAFYAWRGVGQLTRLLEELDVDQIVTTRPQTNGKLEVLNANIQKELFNVETFFDLGETQHRFKAWMSFYNLRRTHHALGGLLVPGDRFFGRADEVLAQIEAGRSPDGLGEPIAVGERVLDLFRITSRGGQLEIWLMGQRLGLAGVGK